MHKKKFRYRLLMKFRYIFSSIKNIIGRIFKLDCGKCFYPSGGTCQFAGEVSNGYWCRNFKKMRKV